MNELNRFWLIANIAMSVTLICTMCIFLPNAVDDVVSRNKDLEKRCEEFDSAVEVFYMAQTTLLSQQKHFLETQQKFKKIQDEFTKEQIRSIQIMSNFQRNVLGY